MNRSLQIRFLREMEIFSSLPNEALRELVKHCRFPVVKQGKVLFNQGDRDREMFTVLSGEIGISIQISTNEEKEIATINTGNFFGEMSLFEKVPRSAKAYAKKETNLLSIDEKAFFSLMEQKPEIAFLIMRKMVNITTQRLQKTNQFVADIVRWGDEARNRAIIDEFTGVYNRRYYDEVVVELFEESKKSDQPFSMVMVDLDHFRAINDTYGHDVGDQLIYAVAQVFKKTLRKTDIVIRFGGDEFVFLYPATDPKKAFQVSERVRKEVRKLDILKKQKGKIDLVTASQGIATYPDNVSSLETMREIADQALYQAKEAGRNKVMCATS